MSELEEQANESSYKSISQFVFFKNQNNIEGQNECSLEKMKEKFQDDSYYFNPMSWSIKDFKIGYP